MISTTAQFAAIRPLNRGMDRETTTQLIEKGRFYDIRNGRITSTGLRRRGGYSLYGSWSLFSLDEVLLGTPLYYDSTGNVQTLLVTNKHLYKLVGSATTSSVTLLSKKLYSELSSTCDTNSGGTISVTVSEATFIMDGLVQQGDTVWIYNETLEYKEPYELVTFTEDTLTVVNHDGATRTGELDVDVVAAFQYWPDWTLAEGKLVYCDNSGRGLWAYDGTNVDEYNEDQDPVLSQIDTVVYFGDRLWIGGVTESSADEKYRIRWTTVDDVTEFPVANFVDLPYSREGIRRLMPLGNLLVAYFGDQIYYGRPTNIVNLPYDFTPLNTGSVGLVGPRAIISWLDSHWFIGQDNLYRLSASRALEEIGNPVYEAMLSGEGLQPSKAIVVEDPYSERIIFMVPGSAQTCPIVWSYYYKRDSWSSETFGGYGIDHIQSSLTYVWSAMTGTWTATTDNWISFFGEAHEPVCLYYRSGKPYVYDANGVSDWETNGAIRFVLESGDFDYDTPDILKMTNQLGIKLRDPRLDAVTFLLETSTNRGQLWINRGNVTIGVGYDEAKWGFSSTGSLFRFRLTSESLCTPYEVTEIVLKAVQVGLEPF